MRRVLNSIAWQLMILIAAAIDISILFVEIAFGNSTFVDVTTLCILVVFTIDVLLRLATYRALFFNRVWNVVDLVVVIISLILFLYVVIVDATSSPGSSSGSSSHAGVSSAVAITRGGRSLIGFVIAIQVVRGVRVARTLTYAGRGTQVAARYITGELPPVCNFRSNRVSGGL